MTRHILPDLPYPSDALEPYIDAETMEIHHGKHHAAYVDKLNAALDKYPELFEPSIEELMLNLPSIPEAIQTDVLNHGGGHANHSFFWPLLGKNKGGAPVGELKKAIDKSFGSFENFKAQFHAVSLKHFGSGWAWLSAGRFGNLLVHCSPNQRNPLMHGLIPVVGLDVWEHAYYLKYRNRRADYVDAFWNVLDWERAESNYRDALRELDAQ